MDQEYLHVYKGDIIYRFMIVTKPEFLHSEIKESNVEKESSIIFITSDNEIRNTLSTKISPQMITCPNKPNLFVVYDSDSIEVVKCNKN